MQSQEAAALGRISPNGEGLLSDLCSGQVFVSVISRRKMDMHVSSYRRI